MVVATIAPSIQHDHYDLSRIDQHLHPTDVQMDDRVSKSLSHSWATYCSYCSIDIDTFAMVYPMVAHDTTSGSQQ